MNNFRRRSSAKKQRTVVSTSYVTSFNVTNVNITNGIFRINTSAGSTADLSITITYTETTHLETRYSDGTVENSNTTTSSGTCTFTKATVQYDDWQGWGIDISSNITLSNGKKRTIFLCNIPHNWNLGQILEPPANQGGEVSYDCTFTLDPDYVDNLDKKYVNVYIGHTVNQYYVNISKIQ